MLQQRAELRNCRAGIGTAAGFFLCIRKKSGGGFAATPRVLDLSALSRL